VELRIDGENREMINSSMFRPIEGEEPEVSLCRFAAETTYADLPDNIIEHCKRSIIDTLAVTIGGSAMEAIRAGRPG